MQPKRVYQGHVHAICPIVYVRTIVILSDLETVTLSHSNPPTCPASIFSSRTIALLGFENSVAIMPCDETTFLLTRILLPREDGANNAASSYEGGEGGAQDEIEVDDDKGEDNSL